MNSMNNVFANVNEIQKNCSFSKSILLFSATITTDQFNNFFWFKNLDFLPMFFNKNKKKSNENDNMFWCILLIASIKCDIHNLIIDDIIIIIVFSSSLI